MRKDFLSLRIKGMPVEVDGCKIRRFVEVGSVVREVKDFVELIDSAANLFPKVHRKGENEIRVYAEVTQENRGSGGTVDGEITSIFESKFSGRSGQYRDCGMYQSGFHYSFGRFNSEDYSIDFLESLKSCLPDDLEKASRMEGGVLCVPLRLAGFLGKSQ